MAKKVKENNEVSAVRRSKHGGVLTVFFSLLTVFYLYPIFLVLINSFKKKGFITKPKKKKKKQNKEKKNK